MTASLLSIRQLISAATICLAATALAQPEQQESRLDAALADLASRETRDRGLTALLAQSGIQVGTPASMHVTMNNLLRTHPQQAERIKTTLIAALETQGAELEKSIREAQAPLSEAFYEILVISDGRGWGTAGPPCRERPAIGSFGWQHRGPGRHLSLGGRRDHNANPRAGSLFGRCRGGGPASGRHSIRMVSATVRDDGRQPGRTRHNSPRAPGGS